MKKKDLKNGMVVVLNNKQTYMVLLDHCFENSHPDRTDCLLGQDGFVNLDNYNDNLRFTAWHPTPREWDVAGVYLFSSYGGFNTLFKNRYLTKIKEEK